jgi:hypothetical protein
MKAMARGAAPHGLRARIGTEKGIHHRGTEGTEKTEEEKRIK